MIIPGTISFYLHLPPVQQSGPLLALLFSNRQLSCFASQLPALTLKLMQLVLGTTDQHTLLLNLSNSETASRLRKTSQVIYCTAALQPIIV